MHPSVQMRSALEAGASVHAVDMNGQTLLHAAAFRGRIKTLRLLIKEGSDVNKSDNAGCTPVHLASYAGSKQAVAALLAEGADVAAKDKFGNTALHDVAGDLEFLKKRFQGGSEQDAAGDYFLTWSPPKTKLSPGHAMTAKLLISKGLDSNAANTDGATPVNMARRLGRNTLLRTFGEVSH